MYVNLIFGRRGKAEGDKETAELVIYLQRGQKKYISLGKMTKKDFRNAATLPSIAEKITKYQAAIKELERSGENLTLENLDKVLGINSGIARAKRRKPKGACKINVAKPKNFFKFAMERLEMSKVSGTTKRQRRVALDALQRSGAVKTFDDLTPQNLKRFDDFIRRENPNRTVVTIKGYHKRIQPYITDAMQLGYIFNNPYNQYKPERGKSKERTPLTKDELKAMENAILSDKLSKVRDLFVFCAYTGLAYADLINFRADRDVEDKDGIHYINGERVKTGSTFYTPILPPAWSILIKYPNGLPRISGQKYNDYLQVIAEKLGIKKHITSHIARHTFATTVALGNDVPIESVAKMLGHRDIKTTQIYAKIMHDTIQRQAASLINKL